MNYFHVKSKVLQKLVEDPRTRDNDNLLIASVILDIETEDLRRISAYDFLNKLQEGLYNFESIRRSRQKLQEKNEALRGKKWESRHKYAKSIPSQIECEYLKDIIFTSEGLDNLAEKFKDTFKTNGSVDKRIVPR